MSDSNNKVLKSSFALALATLCSRLLGLFRVILEAKYLGGGAVASSWHLAFMVPNLFRRLLGEGALGTAMVPLLAHRLEHEGRQVARRHLAAVFVTLGMLLALICVLVSGAAILLVPFVSTTYGKDALRLIPILMPYTFFICFVGVVGAVLNSIRVFFLPALGALLLNIFIIACLLLWAPGLADDKERLLEMLAWTVVWSGVIEFLLLLALLYWYKLSPLLPGLKAADFTVLSELWRMTLPGLIGASALQISFLVDRLLAAWLGPQAVPALTYTDRIVFVPIGVFAISLGAVLLSDMSRHAGRNDLAGMVEALELGLRHVVYICVPLAVFMVVFREQILRLLYFRGSFSESDLRETAWAALFYASGIPFFAAIKITVAAFYARKDMRTPLYASLLCIAVNIILNLLLMFPLRQGGIALATVISSLLNNTLLLYLLRRQLGRLLKLRALFATLLKSAIPAFASVIAIYAVYPFLARLLPEPFPGFQGLLPLTAAGSLFCILYGLISVLFRYRETREIIAIFRRQ